MRPATSSWLKVESFDHLIHNFQASYFAGAVLLPQERLVPDLADLPGASRPGTPALLGDLLAAHQATPEMFLYRMSQLLPGRFGLGRLFYLRFTRDLRNDRGDPLTKELNLTDELVPYGLGLSEHYCRRWLPLQQLARPEPRGAAAAPTPAHRHPAARFLESGSEFLMISMARPLSLSRPQALGHDHRPRAGRRAARRRIDFADDPAIPRPGVTRPASAVPCRRTSAPSGRAAGACSSSSAAAANGNRPCASCWRVDRPGRPGRERRTCGHEPRFRVRTTLQGGIRRPREAASARETR